MKILYPPKSICKEIKYYIGLYYTDCDERDLEYLYRAMMKFCRFYEIPLPLLKMRKSFHDPHCLGQCSDDGLLEFLYPSYYNPMKGNKKQKWIRMVFHELGHYYLWSYAEKKAREFENEMIWRSK